MRFNPKEITFVVFHDAFVEHAHQITGNCTLSTNEIRAQYKRFIELRENMWWLNEYIEDELNKLKGQAA